MDTKQKQLSKNQTHTPHGYKWSLPGVYYPKNHKRDSGLKSTRKGYNPLTDQPYAGEPSSAWVSTIESAKLLGSSISAARVRLLRLKVPYRKYKRYNSPPVAYWKRSKVEQLVASLLPLEEDESSTDWVTTEQAAELIKVGRSTIQRAIVKGEIESRKFRIDSPQGARYARRFHAPSVRQFMRDKIAKARARLAQKEEIL